MKRTYITVTGIVKEYTYPKYVKNKKRPRCEICTNELHAIHTQIGIKRYSKIGYFCDICNNMYMDGDKGTIMRCKIE